MKLITNASGDYNEKNMKIKFNSEDNLPLNKTLKLHNLTVVVGFVFKEDKKYYPQVFLEECLCVNYNCYSMIGQMFRKKLILIRQMRQKM